MDKIPVTQPDISLIPFEELIAEVERRCDTFICGMKFSDADEKGQEIKMKYGKGSWLDAVALSTILQNDCLMRWPEDGE